MEQVRSRPMAMTIAVLLTVACGACTSTVPSPDLKDRLQGNAVRMLGEVHENYLSFGPRNTG